MRICIACAILVAFGCGGLQAAEVLGLPRVALIYSDYGDFRHRDDYDGRLADLGWRVEKFENRDLDKLVERLGEFDILLGSALFNYSNVQDFSRHADRLLSFMERGGAVVLTDANYNQHVDWLKSLGEGWSASSANPGKVGIPAGAWERDHPVFTVPNRIAAPGGTWTYLEPGEGWQVISRDDEGRATGLFRTHGRGYTLVTCFWSYSRGQLENLWGALRCHRAGLVAGAPDLSGLTLGDNRVRISARNITPEPLPFAVEITVTPPAGEPRRYTAEAQVAPEAATELELTVPLEQRGTHRIAASFRGARGEFFVTTWDGPDIPDLLTVDLLRPLYRQALYRGDPPQEIEYAARVHPWKENVETLSLGAKVELEGADGPTTGPVRVAGLDALQPSFRVIDPPGDAVTVRVDLMADGEEAPVQTRRVRVPVLAEKSPRVTIDETLATRVDGEPFFPIAIYHVGMEHLQRLLDLGFNSFQGWGSTIDGARTNLDEAQRLGLKVLLEMSTLLRGETFRKDDLAQMVETFRDHPALLCWYTVDEPDGEMMLARCNEAREICMTLDPYHPVYLVMCSPGSFQRFGAATDILAVDPYPIPNSVTMVSSWMKTAQEAVQERRPIWLIPQLHNWSAYNNRKDGRGPTPTEERNMVYQGLIWGAKGVVYYPWDDTVTGLVYEPELMEAVGRINRELAVVGPETLLARRTLTAANDETHPGLYAASFSGAKRSLVIAASVSDEPGTFQVPAPGLPDGPVQVLFEDRSVTCEGGVIRDEFSPLAVHVYATAAGD